MDWKCNTIWKEQLPAGEYSSFEFVKGKSAIVETVKGTYFNVHKFKTKGEGLEELVGINSAIYLELNFANIKSFSGISRLGKIKRLELDYCLKLESDRGLSEIKNDIEWLHINTSKKFIPTRELFDLHKLKVLCLNSCGPLENLNFLKDMPNLLDFRFVDTNIINGDLTPLLKHPTLVSVGFLDKRHYNIKKNDVDLFFQAKSEAAKEYIYKGEFRTFRYKDFSE
ncbi:MAG: hypothetical protein HOP06_10010 [Methylotenera sp.]|nr:hypothetical protein [Methylotenera sp.]